MKIAILTHDENRYAGWGRFSDQLIEGLRSEGHDVIVLTEEGGNYPILRRGIGMLWSALRCMPLLRHVDIVHAMDVYPFGVIAWIATRFTRKSLVFSAQGSYSLAPLERSRFRWLYRWMTRGADCILAISSYTRDRLTRALSSYEPIQVIGHGIDTKFWHEIPGLKRQPVLISVGAVKYRKGYHKTLEAFIHARLKLPELQWWIVGDTRDQGYMASLRVIARNAGVEDAITWYSGVTDEKLRELYSCSSLFILLSQNQGSHFEGFGLVFLEAAACGLPVIGTRDNGIQDAVSSSNSVLVDQSDSGAAAQAIVRILTDNQASTMMSQASIQWAASHRIHDVVLRYIEHYNVLYRGAVTK